MIRSALIALGLSAGAAQGQGLTPTAPMLETCGGTRMILASSAVAPGERRMPDEVPEAGEVIDIRIGSYFDAHSDASGLLRFSYVEIQGPVATPEARKFVVSLPGSMGDDLQAIYPLLETASLGFYSVVAEISSNVQPVLEAGQIILPNADMPEFRYILNSPPVLDGYGLWSAEATFDGQGHPAIAFGLSNEGAATFEQFTTENIGEMFAIAIGDQVLSVPLIQSPISGGSGIITGSYTLDEAIVLAAILQGGTLPFDVSVVSTLKVDGSDPSAAFCP